MPLSPVPGGRGFFWSQMRIQCVFKQRSDRGKDKLWHCVAFTCVMVFRCPCKTTAQTTVTMKVAMFLTAKVHAISGMVIGALAVVAAKQMCKQWKMRKHPGVPAKVEV